MALATKQDDRLEKKRIPAEVIPIPGSGQPTWNVDERDAGTRETLQEYAGRATKVVNTTKESVRKAYNQARTQASEGYSRVIRKAEDFGKQTQNRAQHLRQEYPVQLIAIIAGAAFVTGIAIRIWRSRNS